MPRRRPRQAGRLTEATLTSVRAQDFVSWASSSGTAKGRVTSVHKGKVPAVPIKFSGTDVSPAARVEIYKEADGGGWEPTGHYLGIASSSLTSIAALPAATTEARTVVTGSFDEIRQRVQSSITDMLQELAASIGSDSRVYVYVSDIGPDWAVYSSGYDDDYYQVSYAMDASGKVTLGAPVEVQQVRSYEPVVDPDVDEATSAPTAEATPPAAATEAVRRSDIVDGRLIEAKGTDETTGGRV